MRQFRTITFWLLLGLVLIVLVQYYNVLRANEQEVSYSDLWTQVKSGNVKEVTVIGREVKGEFVNELPADLPTHRPAFKRFKVYLPAEDPDLAQKIWTEQPGVTIKSRPTSTPWFNLVFSWWIPLLAIVFLWVFFIRQMQSGGSAALKFGKSRARILNENQVKVTFRDVAGADEAKEELQEIIEFLRDPKKFQSLGGRIPKGALLLGPPGTGKTLLAKAVAGEAGVPFFSMSGSDFVEMFVGVGASRVRDLFEQGKKNAPCIIFIDEIDAVGRHRGAGLGGGHDEREQTLNQLLVEMDGFESNDGVILIAATNRPDVLDPALLRPGRFDRQIVVDLPDARGREAILRIHGRNKPLNKDVEVGILARGTPGLAGADLANLMNEAALLAARKNKKEINMRDLEEAKDKVMMGTERKSMLLSDEEKKTTAYHEAGHALVGWLTPDADPIHKVTVIPRGRALGVTHFLPEGDRYTRSREFFYATMAVAMGGRAAEELIFGRITTGAANDIQNATHIARKMVCEWGMSDRLGPLMFGQREEMIFLGREISQRKDYSDRTAEAIDEEVYSLVNGAYEKAKKLLTDNVDKLHAIAQSLLEREILDREEINRLLRGEPLDPVPPANGPSPTAPSPSTEGDPRMPGMLRPPLPGSAPA
ncbi:MAG: ATP-dependent zinc metalloprotease FtsH [Candidatus Eisenbacteria bacterium]|nr:ATP-dependent zinc metalloprotease FtsH [Candidatus Eisenbacteria bacterium]